MTQILTTFAATHLSPWLAVTLASALLAAMAWYWPHLSSPATPALRRRIRRTSMLMGLLGLIAATLGFGIIDPDATPVPYMLAWGAGSLAIFGVVMLAILDALVSVRLHRAAMAATRRASAEALGRAIEEARSRRAKETP